MPSTIPSDVLTMASIPVVMAMVQVIKTMFPAISPRWFPVLSLGFAIASNIFLAAFYAKPFPEAIATGVVVGLTASGLYSGGRTMMERNGADRRHGSP